MRAVSTSQPVPVEVDHLRAAGIAGRGGHGVEVRRGTESRPRERASEVESDCRWSRSGPSRSATHADLRLFVVLGIVDLDFRLLVEPIIRDEDDPHAPACARGEHSAELIPGKLLVVDVDDRPVVWATIADDASENIAPWRPVTTEREVLELRPANRNLDRDVLVFRAASLHGLDTGIATDSKDARGEGAR